MRPPAVILAGGLSSRMGSPKALLELAGMRLIDRIVARLAPQCGRLVINSNDRAIVVDGLERISDRFANFPGPLAGIHAALSLLVETNETATHMLSAPVDCPFLPDDLVARLADGLDGPDSAAVAMSGDQWQPVVALWPLSALPRLDAWLRDPPSLKMRIFLETLTVKPVAFPMLETVTGPLDPFFNINRPGDLATALHHIEGEENP